MLLIFQMNPEFVTMIRSIQHYKKMKLKLHSDTFKHGLKGNNNKHILFSAVLFYCPFNILGNACAVIETLKIMNVSI